jgi:hypothetical protein
MVQSCDLCKSHLFIANSSFSALMDPKPRKTSTREYE